MAKKFALMISDAYKVVKDVFGDPTWLLQVSVLLTLVMSILYVIVRNSTTGESSKVWLNFSPSGDFSVILWGIVIVVLLEEAVLFVLFSYRLVTAVIRLFPNKAILILIVSLFTFLLLWFIGGQQLYELWQYLPYFWDWKLLLLVPILILGFVGLVIGIGILLWIVVSLGILFIKDPFSFLDPGS